MPELCRFAGIIISMFPRDHNPPHFHAYYSGYEVWIDVATLQVGGGYFPSSQLHVLLDWARIHQVELEVAWDTIHAGGIPDKITP